MLFKLGIKLASHLTIFQSSCFIVQRHYFYDYSKGYSHSMFLPQHLTHKCNPHNINLNPLKTIHLNCQSN